VLSRVIHHVRRLAVRCALAATLSVYCAVAAAPSFTASVALAAPDPGTEVADLAQQYVGSPYRWGGTSPAGFDCTGFVLWVYSQFGVAMPHNEAGELASGAPVASDDLQPGDILVFANTYRRGLSHAGIYLGDGRFVHAADESHGVMVSNLWDAYWGPRLVGASRAMA